MAHDELREQVWLAHRDLSRSGLVVLSFGNASGIDRQAGVLAIKPSGVPYDQLTPGAMVVVALEDGRVVEGELRPSSDTPTHLVLYRRFPSVGGVVHTHSAAATAWAQAGLAIPPLGTTHADHFHGPVPVTRPLGPEEIEGAYEEETGKVIVETFEGAGLDPRAVPAALVASHGPFTWGRGAAEAVENAIALETVAAIARDTLALRADAEPASRVLLDRHHLRKHGPSAYYGQVR
ncbi:MAG: L-ribulose-5-phosphate 4-epimerase AraD [Candidatus Dormibacteraeota bacterium]|nr:L-ribulose-5-phosphate 4-epimerase AraD [Candidatus Dormibacteraeota bacterium]